MSAVYPIARMAAISALTAGGSAGTVKAVMVGAAYVYDDAHFTIADITDIQDTAVTVALAAIVEPALQLDGDLTFSGVPAGPSIRGLVFYIDSGPLLCHVDRRADTIPIDLAPNGGDIVFTFVDYLFRL